MAICRSDQPLPPGEAGKRHQDSISDFDVIHSRSHRENAADAFIADDGRERRAERIDALRDHEVVGIDRREFDSREHLVRAWGVRFGNVDEFQTIDGVAKGGEMNGSHRSGPSRKSGASMPSGMRLNIPAKSHCWEGRWRFLVDSTCGQALTPPSTVRFAPLTNDDSGP